MPIKLSRKTILVWVKLRMLEFFLGTATLIIFILYIEDFRNIRQSVMLGIAMILVYYFVAFGIGVSFIVFALTHSLTKSYNNYVDSFLNVVVAVFVVYIIIDPVVFRSIYRLELTASTTAIASFSFYHLIYCIFSIFMGQKN